MAPRLPAHDRRLQIMAGARAAIAEKGSFNVSIRDVGRAAGVSPSAILYHYSTFEALLEAAWDQGIERLAAERQYVLEVLEDAGERLATALHEGLPKGSDDQAYLLYAAIGHYASNPALKARARGFTHREIGMFQTILEAGSAGGAFRLADSSLTVARTIVSMQHGLGLWIVHDDPQIDRVEGERLLRAYAERATGTDLPPPSEMPEPAAAGRRTASQRRR
jgi:AcrR family transcriptional regulator